MNKIFIYLSFLAILGIMLSSCSKEKRLARRLDGSWNVEIFQITVFKDGQVVANESNSRKNAGTITFNDDETGSYSMVVDLGHDSFTGSGTFTWDNSADEVVITEGFLRKEYDVVTDHKEKQEWERVVEHYTFDGYDPSYEYVLEERLTMVKK